MKKILSILLTCVLMILLVSCNINPSNSEKTTDSDTTTTEQVTETVLFDDVFDELKDVTEIEITQKPGDKKCVIKKQEDIKDILDFIKTTEVIELEDPNLDQDGGPYVFLVKYDEDKTIEIIWSGSHVRVNDVLYKINKSKDIDVCLKEIPECVDNLDFMD